VERSVLEEAQRAADARRASSKRCRDLVKVTSPVGDVAVTGG
jgi:hypothetical protein